MKENFVKYLFVYKVIVIDLDVDENVVLIYDIIDGNIDDMFNINFGIG